MGWLEKFAAKNKTHPVSEAQRKWAFYAEEKGELPKGKAHTWSKRVEGKNLPEKIAFLSLDQIKQNAFNDELNKIADEKENESTESKTEEKEEISGAKPADPAVLQKAITDFLVKNKNNDKLTDDDVHKWAEENKYDVHALEDYAWKFARQFIGLWYEGRAAEKGLTEDNVDPEQLKIGMKVESEHTINPQLQKKIAMDHIAEFPSYYNALDKMESELKKQTSQEKPAVPQKE